MEKFRLSDQESAETQKPSWYSQDTEQFYRNIRESFADLGTEAIGQLAGGIQQLKAEHPDLERYYAYHILSGSSPKDHVGLTDLIAFDYPDGAIRKVARVALNQFLSHT
ncbi:MAG: hypothetical protein R3B52_02990 [Candidatus Paceibacterota bacterium]